KRATEFPLEIVDLSLCRPFHGLGSFFGYVPALKRWAIFTPSAIADDEHSDLGKAASLELLVLLLCFNQKREIRLSILPRGEKVLIGLTRHRSVALKHSRAGESELRKRIEVRERRPAAMIEDLLKLRGRLRGFFVFEIGLTAQISGRK